MPSLTIEPAYRVLLRETTSIRIFLIGAGGTGSHLAWALARLAVHARDQGLELQLTFIDHDTIEPKNIGRQCFHPQQLDQNKATALAWQLNATYGLNIAAIPQLFTANSPSKWQLDLRTHQDQALFIGAVDNHVARQALATAVTQHPRLWWLDCGNAQASGQLLLGNTTDFQDTDLNDLGLCRTLPAPHIQAPELIQPERDEQPLSCTDLTRREEQSLFVNQMTATIAAQYVTQFTLHRELTTFATHFTLTPPITTSQLITKSNLKPYFSPQ